MLKSGKFLNADLVITATGLNILAFGGAKISIDSNQFDVSKSYVYKGLMLSNLPNFIIFVGYTNASWTLKTDLTNKYITRVFKYLEKQNYVAFEAKIDQGSLESTPLLNLNSNYIYRVANMLPKQGTNPPWRVYQNYIFDYKMLCIDRIKDKWLKFSS